MTEENSFSSLLTLAILKINYDKQQRYIDTYLPFILNSLQDNPSSNIEHIQSNILDKYRLKIPLNSLKTIIDRAVRKNIIQEISGYYEIISDKYQNINYDLLRNTAMREQKQLIEKFIEFCKSKDNYNITEADAEKAIFTFIRHRDIELLKTTVFGSPFKDDTVPTKELTYYVGKFVTYISEKDQQTFELLHAFIKSYILSELMIFENISDIEKPFKHINFYLDTQFTLRVLGFTSPLFDKACNELIELLYTECCNLYLFNHSLDEIIGILRACQSELYSLTPRLLGEASYYCVENSTTASDLEVFINTIEDKLNEKRIKIVDTPTHTKEFEIDEKLLVDYLNENYHYKNQRARDRDIDSIQAIYRFRGGKKANSIRDCGSVFITTNATLAKHTYAFFYKEDRYTHFPLLITDHLTTNLIWSRKTEKYDNISRNQRLADAFALTNPTYTTWEKYYNEIKKLISQKRLPEEEAMLFLYSSEINGTIMDITKGGTIEPNESNVFDIINEARKRLTQHEKDEIIKLKNKLSEAKSLKEDNVKKDKTIYILENKINQHQKTVLEIVQIIKRISIKTSKIFSWFIIFIPIISIIIALLNLVPYPYHFISSAILLIITFLNLLKGTNLLSVRRKIEVYFYKKMIKVFKI